MRLDRTVNSTGKIDFHLHRIWLRCKAQSQCAAQNLSYQRIKRSTQQRNRMLVDSTGRRGFDQLFNCKQNSFTDFKLKCQRTTRIWIEKNVSEKRNNLCLFLVIFTLVNTMWSSSNICKFRTQACDPWLMFFFFQMKTHRIEVSKRSTITAPYIPQTFCVLTERDQSGKARAT